MAEPARIVSPRQRQKIDLRAAAAGALRAWLALRDEALMRFCGGTDETDRIPELALDGLQDILDRMNSMRALAVEFATKAGQVEGKHTQVVLTEIADQVLVAESPTFLLTLPGDIGTF
jgi:hypothetical protein